ncbi:unnamed protein product, partial [Sphacelaria rigidula]
KRSRLESTTPPRYSALNCTRHRFTFFRLCERLSVRPSAISAVYSCTRLRFYVPCVRERVRSCAVLRPENKQIRPALLFVVCCLLFEMKYVNETRVLVPLRGRSTEQSPPGAGAAELPH